MTAKTLVDHVRDNSSDPHNPSAEELTALIDRVRNVAVVGISRDPTKAARRVPSYMAAKGYQIIPVNPFAERILGRNAFATLGEVAEPVDMVLVFRPSAEAGEVMRQAATRPERPAIWLQEDIRDDAVAAQLREEGLTVVQDLCFYKTHQAVLRA